MLNATYRILLKTATRIKMNKHDEKKNTRIETNNFIYAGQCNHNTHQNYKKFNETRKGICTHTLKRLLQFLYGCN